MPSTERPSSGSSKEGNTGGPVTPPCATDGGVRSPRCIDSTKRNRRRGPAGPLRRKSRAQLQPWETSRPPFAKVVPARTQAASFCGKLRMDHATVLETSGGGNAAQHSAMQQSACDRGRACPAEGTAGCMSVLLCHRKRFDPTARSGPPGFGAGASRSFRVAFRGHASGEAASSQDDLRSLVRTHKKKATARRRLRGTRYRFHMRTRNHMRDGTQSGTRRRRRARLPSSSRWS